MNYYQILGLKRDAADEQVAQSYKRLALKWHHKFTKEDKATSFHHFCQISQAYQVLSDPVKRAFYDKYGEEKLKEGFFAEGQLKGGYRFAKNPDEIFQNFFHNNNTFAKVFDRSLDSEGSLFSHAFGAQNYKREDQRQDVVVEIPCTLIELYNGCSKQIDYTRTKVNLDGRTTTQTVESRKIEILAGYGKQSKIVVEGAGNQIPGQHRSSNLILKIKQVEHPKFKRAGNDLIYTVDIKLVEALNAEPVEIIALDNRKLFVSFDEIISPKTVKEVENEGMPIVHDGPHTSDSYGKSQPKGSLYIRFNIEFPHNLSEDKKKRLRACLQ